MRCSAPSPANVDGRPKGGAMAQETTDVLVAGYQDIDAATADFEALVALVKEKKVAIEGVILVTHARGRRGRGAPDGRPPGPQGRWAGAAGSASRSACSRRRCSRRSAVGAVAGGVIGKFVDHRVENEIHDKIGENLPPGSAGIIAVFDDEQRLGVEQALAGAADPLGRPDATSRASRALKESLAEAMGKFSPDRTRAADPGPELRRHDRAHARRVGPGLDDQHDADAARGRAERPARPDRRCRLRRTRRRSAARCRRRR